jgi:hypothetical protein
MQCQVCKLWFGFGEEDPMISEIEGSTMDCPHCDALLIVEDGFAKNFHVVMHNGDSRWPVDGKNTGFIEV